MKKKKRARLHEREPKPGSAFARSLREYDAIYRALAASEREDLAREKREREERERAEQTNAGPPRTSDPKRPL